MAKGLLGFGWMRLPQLSPESTDIDYEQVNQMVDLYLDSGFDYFDTSYVYHDGGSETAIYKCLVSRHPRESFRLASKLPTFAITEETQVEQILNALLNMDEKGDEVLGMDGAPENWLGMLLKICSIWEAKWWCFWRLTASNDTNQHELVQLLRLLRSKFNSNQRCMESKHYVFV